MRFRTGPGSARARTGPAIHRTSPVRIPVPVVDHEIPAGSADDFSDTGLTPGNGLVFIGLSQGAVYAFEHDAFGGGFCFLQCSEDDVPRVNDGADFYNAIVIELRRIFFGDSSGVVGSELFESSFHIGFHIQALLMEVVGGQGSYVR